MILDDTDDGLLGPYVCKSCRLDWHEDCDNFYCECDDNFHDEPENPNGK